MQNRFYIALLGVLLFGQTIPPQKSPEHQRRWVSRKDVKYLVDPGQKKLQVVSYEKWGDRTNELVQTYNKLIMREDR